MQRVAAVDPATAAGFGKELLDTVHKSLGITPNMMRTMAQSPVVLNGYLQLNAALAARNLNGRLRESLTLAVAESNGCEYCLSAHSLLGRKAGLSEAEVTQSRRGLVGDARMDAALNFARAIVAQHGAVSDADIESVRNAGFSDGEIAEIVANVALNIFTNYFNLVALTEIDFPKVALSAASAK